MYTDDIERFLVEVMRLSGNSFTEETMSRVFREVIEKWDAWKIEQEV